MVMIHADTMPKPYDSSYDLRQQAAQVPRPAPTASEEVFAAMEEARELSYRVKEAVNRFCGHTPEVAGGKATDASPSAIFPSLRQASADTMEIVRSAQEALSRLERELQ